MWSWIVSAIAGLLAALAALASDAPVVVWQAVAAIGLAADTACGNAQVGPGGSITQPLCEAPVELRILGVMVPAVAALMVAWITRRVTRADGNVRQL